MYDMRHPFGSIWRVTDECRTVIRHPIPTMDATSARKLIAQGLLHGGRRPTAPVSGAFSASFACNCPFAVMIKPRVEDDDVRSGDDRFSIVPFPLRGSGNCQLTPLDRRLIEKEGRRSALRRRSSLLAGCAEGLRSLVRKREELTWEVSTGGASSSSDDPDECLLIPAGAVVEDSCPGGSTVRS